MASQSDIVRASGLVKRYGEVTALDGLDFTVPEGTLLGLLGPNGAGKTTAVNILSSLLEPDEGSAFVAGFDVSTQPEEVRKRIGLSGQFAAVDEVLTGFENLEMIGRLYHLGRPRAKERARELLERFDLTESADRPVKGYSGGMRRRLDVAGALVAEPPVLFLDEPTTGLDPRSRADLWAFVRELVASGTTLLLTTQYLEEADQLSDEILVIDRGRAIASGTSDQLKAQVGGERIAITIERADELSVARDALASIAVGEVQVDESSRTLAVPISGGASDLMLALRALEERNVSLTDAGLRRPTLDDVFLTLTGHAAEEDQKGGPDGQEGPVSGDGLHSGTAAGGDGESASQTSEVSR